VGRGVTPWFDIAGGGDGHQEEIEIDSGWLHGLV